MRHGNNCINTGINAVGLCCHLCTYAYSVDMKSAASRKAARKRLQRHCVKVHKFVALAYVQERFAEFAKFYVSQDCVWFEQGLNRLRHLYHIESEEQKVSRMVVTSSLPFPDHVTKYFATRADAGEEEMDDNGNTVQAATALKLRWYPDEGDREFFCNLQDVCPGAELSLGVVDTYVKFVRACIRTVHTHRPDLLMLPVQGHSQEMASEVVNPFANRHFTCLAEATIRARRKTWARALEFYCIRLIGISLSEYVRMHPSGVVHAVQNLMNVVLDHAPAKLEKQSYVAVDFLRAHCVGRFDDGIVRLRSASTMVSFSASQLWLLRASALARTLEGNAFYSMPKTTLLSGCVSAESSLNSRTLDDDKRTNPDDTTLLR
ncbi:hypothetical protein FVE85_4590 [Porphyridium purpureum]|uniref:Uncharacterized protein n=1 Tax=Porphyridium purpureum TaxID=35688 RepID=A0A5J4YGP3_PORPP|nr:hypothetical protein FVE85_4590 [Porphyridium purpureum]|eukprot:POR8517..scf252_32